MRKKRREEFEQREKERLEAREQSRREAQAVRDARQKAEEKLRAEHNLFMSKELDSLFGIQLGGRALAKGLEKTDSKAQVFVPEKKFRDFKTYSYWAENGKITEIRAMIDLDDLDEMKKEFYTVVSVLDRKYGAERRCDVSEESMDKLRCQYDFGCDLETGRSAKQRLVVRTERVPNAFKYRIKIFAYLVEEANAAHEKEQQQDMDAL